MAQPGAFAVFRKCNAIAEHARACAIHDQDAASAGAPDKSLRLEHCKWNHEQGPIQNQDTVSGGGSALPGCLPEPARTHGALSVLANSWRH